MKKLNLLLTFLFLVSICLQAERKEPVDTLKYQLVERIMYRDVKLEKLDDYAKQNCQLDFYYPISSVALTFNIRLYFIVKQIYILVL